MISRNDTPSRLVLSAVLLLLGCAALGGHASAQVQFTDTGVAAGLQAYVMAEGLGGGAAAADFDDDGDIDLFVPTETGTPDQLYRNNGDGTFSEIAAAAGVDSTVGARAALWFDYDGDRRLDLFVAGDCYNEVGGDLTTCLTTRQHRLYRQVSDAQFQDVTAAAGLLDDLTQTGSNHRGGGAAGDLDGNGYLDLVIGLWQGDAQVFLNNGDGTFTDISTSSNIGGAFGHHWQAGLYDFDRDGLFDVYYNIDFAANEMWLNQGDDTFSDAATSSGTDSDMNEMGLAFGDYDNDGDMDIYATNIFGASTHNVLMRDDSVSEGGMVFSEVSQSAGVDDGHFGWGSTFLDFDNDGDLDLAATNGFMDQTDPSVLFRNDGGSPVTFTEVAAATGLDDTEWGSGLIAFDYDRDGWVDLLQVNNGFGAPNEHSLLLRRNVPDAGTQDNHYLVVKPRMAGPNTRAIGAVVRVEVGGTTMMRPITAGISFASQEPAEAVFGLGSATSADLVTIEWPNGWTSSLADVAADQELTMEILFADGFESGDPSAWSSAVN